MEISKEVSLSLSILLECALSLCVCLSTLYVSLSHTCTHTHMHTIQKEKAKLINKYKKKTEKCACVYTCSCILHPYQTPRMKISSHNKEIEQKAWKHPKQGRCFKTKSRHTS